MVCMEPRRRFKMASQEEVEQAVHRFTPAGTQEIAEVIGLSRQCTAPSCPSGGGRATHSPSMTASRCRDAVASTPP